MPGSATRTAAAPRPLELLARLLMAAVLILGGAHLFERTLVRSLLPAFSRTIPFLDDEFTVVATDITLEGPNNCVRFRLNLARPIVVGTRVLYPFGWGTRPAGGFQVTITVGGVLQYPVLIAILVLAWPASRVREYCVRLAIATPLAAVLLLVDVPLAVLAELWNTIYSEVAPGTLQPLLIWSRFLMGGGGLALGLLFGGIAIVLARAASSPLPPSPTPTAPHRPQSGTTRKR